MSQHLDSLALGDEVEVKGPVGHFVYEGRGKISLHNKPALASHISLIAGGTGITPCWQVIRAVCEDPEDTTKVGGGSGYGAFLLLSFPGVGHSHFRQFSCEELCCCRGRQRKARVPIRSSRRVTSVSKSPICIS